MTDEPRIDKIITEPSATDRGAGTARPGVNDRVVDGPLLDLRDQLVAAAARRASTSNEPTSSRPTTDIGTRRPSASRWLVAAAAILLIAAVAIGASLATDDTDVAADVNVERVGDSISVSIDDDVTPAQIEDALDEAGVEVTVKPQTTGPSLVDRFVGIIGPPGAELTGGDGTSAAAATFAVGSKVELRLGVAPEGDADYDVPTDATANGEPLAGTDVIGRTVSAARPDIDRAVGDRVKVEFRTSDGGVTSEPDPTSVIATTVALSPNRVLILVT